MLSCMEFVAMIFVMDSEFIYDKNREQLFIFMIVIYSSHSIFTPIKILNLKKTTIFIHVTF